MPRQTDVLLEPSHLSSTAMEQLRKGLLGDVILPGDPGYDQARAVWNGAIDKRPAAIVYCATPEDVVHAVAFARSHGFLVAIRSGGHNVAGLSVCDYGMVIDLSHMKKIVVDPERRIARAEAGVNLGEFDAATQAFGLATTMGVNSDTGIAGLTLGGGFGKLGRKHGLSCDNLIAAEIVTADGRLLRTSAGEHPELFWALRGGGGNFGIVTAFEYRLHALGPALLVGSVLYAYDQAREAMRFYHEFSRDAPDEASVDAALVTLPSGDFAFSISACYIGSPEAGEPVIAPLMKFGSPIESRLQAVPYLQIQSAGDSLFPRGRRYYWKAQFLREISDGAIDALLDTYARAPNRYSLLVFQQVGGAIARVPASHSPYGNRDAALDCFPVAIWDDPADDEANMRWARDLWNAVRPFSTGGVYSNNLGDEGDERVREAYGGNYARLAAIKKQYDPTNFFRLNQNIRPA
ncbi:MULTISPECIES: FAD-binding oxidoreductase [unclassified Mesorhizobium]|uniref:FAD-binding oxidoreductase n=1 Tax=unclassified Mesorhizobium TaxID=325217 RepID=UPI001CCC164B|nr:MULTISPECIES: FAD-binding oxidoreductase [unclassified Mesorhizobium]MBZ9683870.1 FAD-binding oxidoreductase [Mesorhizobium sp. CO1-1-2]MBZ9696606.1 FAD-binding oxidoreductase [Mesorhizobium sp. CO1-1-9]MBZ9725403.1 FAD-binding oxidoreductase [Mesorhizobium sp. CO1-1-11]MBZ9923662.1 FAD-binding oxidoreductase [Mesorhizobium sp. BR1-1-4]